MITSEMLNNPIVLAVILKGVVKEYKEVSLKDLMENYFSKIHRKLTYGTPYPLEEKECYYYDVDIPVEGSIEDMPSLHFWLYTEDRRYLNRLDKLFYLNGPRTLKRGYRIAVVLPTEEEESHVDNYSFKQEGKNGKAEEVPGGYDSSHFIAIHIGSKASANEPDYVAFLRYLLDETVSLEEKNHKMEEVYPIYC